MPNLPPHILLIDDDPSVLGLVGDALTHYGMKVHPFSEGHRALRLLEDPDSPQFDLVITDINMEGMDGFDVINRVKSTKPGLPVIVKGDRAVQYEKIIQVIDVCSRVGVQSIGLASQKIVGS